VRQVDGKLFNRQGAGWPIRVITIHGRKESDAISPKSGSIERAESWEQVYENFTDSMDSIGRDVGIRKDDAGNATPAEGQIGLVSNDGIEASSPNQGGRSGAGTGGNRNPQGNVSGHNGTPDRHSGKSDVHGQLDVGTEPSSDVSTTKPERNAKAGTDTGKQGNEHPGVDGVDRIDRERELKDSEEEASDFQAPYDSESAGFNEKVLTPGGNYAHARGTFPSHHARKRR